MKPKLLILDDQEIYIRALVRALRGDYEIVSALSVAEAQERVADDMAIALVDVRLREDEPANRDGLKFVRWLKGNRPTVPVVAMSAVDDQSLPDEAKTAGAALFLQKPLRMSELKHALSTLVENKE